MRVIRNILSQLHVYVVWAILSAVLWGFVFNFLTDAPAENKLVLFAEVESCRDREFSAALEAHRPEGIRLIQAHSFNYVMFDEASLLHADLYIVPKESIEEYRDSFRPLDPDALPAAAGEILMLDGEPFGICVWDGETGFAANFLDYGAGEYYLLLGANSLHAGGKDRTAYWLIEEILQMKNEE